MTAAADHTVRAAVPGEGGAPGATARRGPVPRTTPLTLPVGISLDAGPTHGWGWAAAVHTPAAPRTDVRPGWGWAVTRPGRSWAVGGAPGIRCRTTLRAKLREWSSRYLLAEVAGTLCAVAAVLAVHAATGSMATAALAASIAESVAFYAVVLRRLLPGLWRAERGGSLPGRVGRTARATVTEASDFLAAEAVDTLLLRPGLIFLAAGWSGSGVVWGLLIGKLLADVGFYAVVIPSYELRKRLMHG
jgi:hypothetical protein